MLKPKHNFEIDIRAVYDFMLESEEFRNGLQISEKLRILRISTGKPPIRNLQIGTSKEAVLEAVLEADPVD